MTIKEITIGYKLSLKQGNNIHSFQSTYTASLDEGEDVESAKNNLFDICVNNVVDQVEKL